MTFILGHPVVVCSSSEYEFEVVKCNDEGAQKIRDQEMFCLKLDSISIRMKSPPYSYSCCLLQDYSTVD